MSEQPTLPARRVLWEGPQFETHSLSIVNNELCSRLLDRGVELSLQPFEPVPSLAADACAAKRRLVDYVGRPLSGPADLTVRHQWPPNFAPPSEGRFVLIQPWEFGSIPRDWIGPINDRVDELWCYTPYVRDCYVRSGVDPERVRVLSLGVDPARFHPGARPLQLATERSFKFLFVGGTIYRKGIDVLLEAYGKTFDAGDDVCLVVKAVGSDTSYAGQNAAAEIAAFQSREGAPELLYLDSALRADEMPGLYTAADALVHPYRGEGFGLPIVEAMAAALPVIVTDRGAARAFCEPAWSYSIPSRDVALASPRVGELETVDYPTLAEPEVDALGDILHQVWRDPSAARIRGHLAREQVRTRFSWEHAADAYCARIDALSTTAARDRSAAAQSPDPTPPLAQHNGQAGGGTAERATPILWSAAPFNYSGYAKISRTLLPALDAAGLQVQLKAFGTDEGFATDFNRELRADPEQALVWNRLINRRAADGVGVHLHPPVSWDGHRFFREFRRENPGLDAYVGFTMFETDRLPARWAAECNGMDEVWVPSEFNREVFAESGVDEDKLRVFHPGIDIEPFRLLPERKSEDCYAIPGRRGFTFLSVFQWTLRKGWDVLLDAWAQAFSAEDDVCLVLRCYPGNQKQLPIRQRIDAYLRASGRPPEQCAPIVLIDTFVSDADMPALYAAADAFVLPSRGEAWGLPYLEAMAAGLPTIAPDWGGQLQFMNDSNSLLIEVEGLAPVAEEQQQENPYYTADLRWAEPSRSHLAECLRSACEGPEEMRALGARARDEVFARWGVAQAAADCGGLCSDLGARAPARDHPRDRFAAPARVLWNSPLYDPSGYADEARQFVHALDARGVALRCLPIAWDERRVELPDAERELFEELEARPVRSSHELVHVQHAFGKHFRASPAVHASVGRTMFETDGLPADWIAPCNAVDEVWVPSRFNVETFARAGVAREKLYVIPSPIDATRYAGEIAPLPAPERRGFAFLSVFDWSRRKGWDLLLRAFVDEFSAREDVCLVLKVSSASGMRPKEIQRSARRFLQKHAARAVGDAAPILWLDEQHAAAEMPRIYRGADAYVMPSRGEGWGRPYMEAMACGLPTIGTGWGGNTEYMTPDNSYLLDSELTAVDNRTLREIPQFRGQRWAEPSLGHLRSVMREVFEAPEAARERGERARTEVLARFDRERVAEAVVARLDALGARQSSARSTALEAPAEHTLEQPDTCSNEESGPCAAP